MLQLSFLRPCVVPHTCPVVEIRVWFPMQTQVWETDPATDSVAMACHQEAEQGFHWCFHSGIYPSIVSGVVPTRDPWPCMWQELNGRVDGLSCFEKVWSMRTAAMKRRFTQFFFTPSFWIRIGQAWLSPMTSRRPYLAPRLCTLSASQPMTMWPAYTPADPVYWYVLLDLLWWRV